ncbi:MAG: efflux RND transporter permease subunit [Myxococcales bacterium]|nr:efflux RND transporter permease subunit [Myxococcales bacterium]
MGHPAKGHELEAPRSAFFAAWARLVLRMRFPLLALILAVSVFAALQVKTKLVVDPTTRGFFGEEHPATLALNELESSFGSDALMQVIVEGEVFTMPFLERLRALHEDLERIDVELPQQRAAALDLTPAPVEGATADDFADFGDAGWGDEAGGSVIDEVVSLVNVRQTEWRDGGLWVGGLLDRWPEEADLPALRAKVMADAKLVGQVIGREGRHAVLVVRTQNMAESDRNLVFAEVEQIVTRYREKGARIWLGGPAALNATVSRVLMNDFQRLIGAGMLLIVIIVALIFRHPLGVIGPALVVAMSAVWTLGAMSTLGSKMTIVSNILPLFLICVGMGDSVHMQSVYRDNRRRGLENNAAIVDAVAATGIPVFFTTLTTALGLLSFRMASLGAIREMGAFGAFGVFVALTLSLVLLPIVLTFNKRSLLGVKTVDRGPDLIDRVLGACNMATRDPEGGVPRRRTRGLLVGTTLVGLLSAGALQIYVHHDPLAWMPDHYDIKQAFRTMDEHVGGTSSIAMLINPKEGHGLKDRELMLGLEALEQHTRAYVAPSGDENFIGTTTGVLDVVRESHRAVNGGSDDAYRVPETDRGVVDMFTLFENSGPDELKRLATVDLSSALMVIRVKWLEASAYGPVTDHFTSGVEANLGKLADVRLTGAVFSSFQVVRSLITDLLRSFSLAFVVITLVMVVLLRGLKLGLIAMVPNLMPILAVIGFMGWTGIAINGANLMLASIAIGIAVDDTIHFLHQFRNHYDHHGQVEAALEHAFDHSGRAMVSTSLILCGGFLVFVVSDMSNIQEFGMLIALSIALALVIDVLFLPALLRTFYRDRVPVVGASEAARAPGLAE